MPQSDLASIPVRLGGSNSSSPRFSVSTLGCKVNLFESEQISGELIGRGYARAPGGTEADICIVNTCTVTAEADRQARQKIRRVIRENPDARIVVNMRDPLECVPSNLKLMEGNYLSKGWTKEDYHTSIQVLEDMSYDCFHNPRDVLQKNPQTPSMVADYRDLVSQPKATVEAIYEAFGLPMSDEYRAILEERDNKARAHKTSHKYSAKEFGMDVDRMYRELADFYKDYGWPIPGEAAAAEAT